MFLQIGNNQFHLYRNICRFAPAKIETAYSSSLVFLTQWMMQKDPAHRPRAIDVYAHMTNNLSDTVMTSDGQFYVNADLAAKTFGQADLEDEEARMVLHEMSKEDLESYQADWGAIVFFQPKRIFSDEDHCKMLALYREGKGIVYIFYLFNKASEEVDLQKNCLSFLPKEIKEEE